MKHLKYLCVVVLMLALIPGCSQDDSGNHLMNSMSTISVGGVNGITGEYCTVLYAGQDINAGTVCVEAVDAGDTEELCVTYTTTGGWELVETHLWLGTALADMPQTRKGNPKIGNFPYKSGDITGQTTYTFCVDLAEFGGEAELCGQTLMAAAHAALQLVDDAGNVIQTETGWGNGDPMVERGNWATYFGIQFTCGDVPPGQNSETAFAYDCWDALCFIDIPDEGINRWGWTNGAYGPGTYYLDIYAGAGQCDITKGTRVGLLTVDYDGTTATVTYETCGNYTMTETHLYVGNDILAWDDNSADPGYTVAPGQYPYIHENLGNVQTDVFTVAATGDIYVVAHAVVWGDYEEGDCGVRGCVPPDKIWNLPTDPITVVMASGAHPGSTNNYFDLTLSGVGTDYDIWDGVWPGWCVDEHVYIYYNTQYTANVYSSYDPNLPSWATDDEQWDYINYILNHKAAGATYVDIQQAIWYFSDAGVPMPGGLAGDMVNDALANGAGFRPSSGEFGAIILAIGTNVQLVFIEVDP